MCAVIILVLLLTIEEIYIVYIGPLFVHYLSISNVFEYCSSRVINPDLTWYLTPNKGQILCYFQRVRFICPSLLYCNFNKKYDTRFNNTLIWSDLYLKVLNAIRLNENVMECIKNFKSPMKIVSFLFQKFGEGIKGLILRHWGKLNFTHPGELQQPPSMRM